MTRVVVSAEEESAEGMLLKIRQALVPTVRELWYRGRAGRLEEADVMLAGKLARAIQSTLKDAPSDVADLSKLPQKELERLAKGGK